MRKQICINTAYRKVNAPKVLDATLAEAERADLVQDIPLSRQIISDLEYGVGNRPTLPSCYDDDDFWKSGQVDKDVDIRRSKWDDLADACNPNAITPQESTTETPTEPSFVD